jgi:carbon storage regulator
VLVLSRGPEEAIMIGEEVEVRVLDVRGDKVRLGIIAPGSVAVHRKEIFLSIQRENRAATASVTAGIDGALEMLSTRGPGPAGGVKTGGRPAEPSPASRESEPAPVAPADRKCPPRAARQSGKAAG